MAEIIADTKELAMHDDRKVFARYYGDATWPGPTPEAARDFIGLIFESEALNTRSVSGLSGKKILDLSANNLGFTEQIARQLNDAVNQGLSEEQRKQFTPVEIYVNDLAYTDEAGISTDLKNTALNKRQEINDTCEGVYIHSPQSTHAFAINEQIIGSKVHTVIDRLGAIWHTAVESTQQDTINLLIRLRSMLESNGTIITDNYRGSSVTIDTGDLQTKSTAELLFKQFNITNPDQEKLFFRSLGFEMERYDQRDSDNIGKGILLLRKIA